jgi:hypothetical protein
MDGDKVLVKIDPPTKWSYLEKPRNAVCTTASKYSNQQVIERRVVDAGTEKPEERAIAIV